MANQFTSAAVHVSNTHTSTKSSCKCYDVDMVALLIHGFHFLHYECFKLISFYVLAAAAFLGLQVELGFRLTSD